MYPVFDSLEEVVLYDNFNLSLTDYLNGERHILGYQITLYLQISSI